MTLVLTAALFLSADWPQWRGPNRDAVADVGVVKWPEKLTAKWKIDVGEGHSSPIFGGGRAYVFARQNDQEIVRAIDPASGKVIWQQAYAAPYQMNEAAVSHGKGPKSTPLFANGKLYTFGIHGTLTGWDAATGKQLWRHDFKASPLYGAAASPIAFENTVIIHGGGPNQGFLTAFDATTGAQKWTWKEDGPGYASPVVATVDGVPQLITESEKNLISVNARTGQLIWKVPFSTAYDQNSVTPVVRGDLLIYSGLDNGITAARLTAKGPQTLWQSKTASMYMNSPVWQGDLLCGFSHKNKGQYFCLNSTNGQVHWSSPGRQGENAAMVLLNRESILALSNEAQLQVIAMQPKSFEVVKKYEASTSPTWAHPAIVPGGILIKDLKSLMFYPL
jgi:outer membrane protein assembly factor BamB